MCFITVTVSVQGQGGGKSKTEALHRHDPVEYSGELSAAAGSEECEPTPVKSHEIVQLVFRRAS